jgi:hypothetical protein
MVSGALGKEIGSGTITSPPGRACSTEWVPMAEPTPGEGTAIRPGRSGQAPYAPALRKAHHERTEQDRATRSGWQGIPPSRPIQAKRGMTLVQNRSIERIRISCGTRPL